MWSSYGVPFAHPVSCTCLLLLALVMVSCNKFSPSLSFRQTISACVRWVRGPVRAQPDSGEA